MTKTTVKALHLGRPVVWQAADIAYFEAADKYVTAHRMDGGKLLLSESLRTLEAAFDGQFIRVSRAFLVARRLIVEAKSFSDRIEGHIALQGVPSPIPCGRKYMRDVKDMLRAA